MAKLSLDVVTNGATLSTLNANFDKIEAEFQNKVLYRDNPIGETNTIRNDTDHDGNDIFNVGVISVDEMVIDGVPVTGGDIASIPQLRQDVDVLQAEMNTAQADIITNANIEAVNNAASLRTSGSPITPIPSTSDRANKYLVFDVNGNPISSFGTGADLGLREDLSDSAGAGLVGFLQQGSGAILRTLLDKARERRSIEDFYDGEADYSLAIEKAIAAGVNVLMLGPNIYTYSSDLVLPNGFAIIGCSKNTSVLRYSGTGTALTMRSIEEPVIRSFSHVLMNVLVQGDGRLGGTGIDMDSVSEALLLDVTVANFTTGVKLHSGISGGCVYNRFVGVKAQNCDVGFDLYRDGGGLSSYTNDNVFEMCRTNICDIGMSISGGNHNVLNSMQIESGGVGIVISEPATATANANTITFCRFENNSVANIQVGANVTHTMLIENTHITGVPLQDLGVRTQSIGTYAPGTPHKRVSPYQIAEGSFRYERSANGGTQIPMMVLHEQSSLNSPVTGEIHSSSTSDTASFLRMRFGGDTGTIKFDVQPRSGKLYNLSAVNGPVGGAALSAASTSVINNTSVSASSLIFLSPANLSAAQLQATKGAYVSARTAGTSFTIATGDGTAAAGTEIFWYWLVN